MDDYIATKVSVSVRNAISVNSIKDHQLEKQVRNLEAERDIRLLNLQMKKDEMFFGSPNSQRRKVLVKSPSVSDGMRTGTPSSQQEISDLNTGLSREEEEFNRLQKAHNLPPLHSDKAGIVATPPRIRKARNLHPGSSPVPITSSRLAQSPKPEHKLATRQSSSPQMLSSSNSMTNVNETRREEHLESKQQFSPRLPRTNIDSSVPLNSPTSPKSLNFDQPSNLSQILRRPATAASVRESGSSEVYRGLLLLPVSSSKEKTKIKEQKKASVFTRLYSSAKKRDRKRIGSDDTAPQALHLPHGKLNAKLETRRRSVSLSDLSEICDKLKTCRYLRSNSHNGDS